MSLAWCKQPDIGLPKPDMVCFLDVSEGVAMKRAGFGEERYEVNDFQRKVRGIYSELSDPTWVIVPADGTKEEVEKEVYKAVAEVLEREDKQGLGKLWVSE